MVKYSVPYTRPSLLPPMVKHDKKSRRGISRFVASMSFYALEKQDAVESATGVVEGIRRK